MSNSPIDLQLPYITRDLPGIGGVLRAEIDHFTVEEIPLYEPQGDGQHLYISLTKEGLTTKDVQQQLARLFDLGKGAVGFAGMKDKVARTTQTFSLGLGHIDAAQEQEAVQRIRDHLPVTVHWARRHGNKLKTGHLLGNRFRIRISQTEGPDVQARTRAIIGRLLDTGLPNFFGPQRFGTTGGNVERGRDILLKRQRVRDRWLKRFLISSYQSYLCNRYLARRVETGAFDHLLLGDVAKKYDTGGIFTVEDLPTDQARYAAKEISFTAPMYGFKMRTAEQESRALEDSILTEAAITLDHLHQARVQGTRRLGRLLVPDLALRDAVQDSLQPETVQGDTGQPCASIQKAETGEPSPFHKKDTKVTDKKHDDDVIIEFSLPKGAFATAVLREIMKTEHWEEEDAGEIDE